MNAWLLKFWLGLSIGFGVFLGEGVNAGVVNDPIGDASGHADAISISGRFSNGYLYLTANFKPGSLNSANLGFTFGLDLDRNTATGVQPPASFPLGADATVSFNSASNPTDAWLVTDMLFQRLKVLFGPNSLSLIIPLSSLGSYGVMGFGFIVGVPNGTQDFVPYDTVPNSAWNGPLSDLTSPVPELKIRRDGSTNIVSWDARATDYFLQSATTLTPVAVWTDATNGVIITDGEAAIQDTVAAPLKFYRMRL